MTAALLLAAAALLAQTPPARAARAAPPALRVTNCSVVIAGGSTAALAAAVASAREGVRTCLLEPTDWPGGQMTSAGDPAIDFSQAPPITDATGRVDIAWASHFPGNHAPDFFAMLDTINTTGRCSVSTNCFPPKALLRTGVDALLAEPAVRANLDVYLRAVPVAATSGGGSGGGPAGGAASSVASVTFVQRFPTPTAACGGWDVPLSEALEDWYSPDPSARFDKRVLEFAAASLSQRPPVFVEATEWGELLALLDAPYLQGASERFDGDTSGVGNDQCGQSFSVTLTATLHATRQNETDVFPPMPEPYYRGNCNSASSCEFIWTRRRLVSTNAEGKPAAGDVTLFVVQDWRWSYMYKSMAEARADAAAGRWAGGLNLSVVRLAEEEGLGWYGWLKKNFDLGPKLTLRDNASSTSDSPLGTCTGLTKMPYIRDSRRTVGIGGFVINQTTILWDKKTPLREQPVGLPWPDRCAIAAFQIDVHEMFNYQPNGEKCYPPYINNGSFSPYYNERNVLPFSVPLRALTNAKITDNLIAAGKTIATSFLVSSAVRLHPGEWATGSAAGAVAATLAKTGGTAAGMVVPGSATQKAVLAAAQRHTPRDWVLNCTAAQQPRSGEGWSCLDGSASAGASGARR